MKKTKYTDEQIATALRQAKTGTAVTEVCRKIGISEATYYNCKKVWRLGSIRTRAAKVARGRECTLEANDG